MSGGARVMAVAVLLLASLASCATGGANAAANAAANAGALRSRSLGNDDRVVLRRHTDVLAVAASTRHVFALTTRGLLTYDRVFSRWQAPSSRVDEELTLAGVGRLRGAVLAADAIEEAVWIGVPGAVVLYRTQSEQVQRITIVGQPEIIGFVRGDTDVYVRASGRWLQVSRAGFVTPLSGGIGDVALIVPPQLGDVYRTYPALRGQLAFLLRDDDSGLTGGFASVTTGTLSPDQTSEVWLGTRSHGLWRIDANFLRAERMHYGVLDDMIGAVATTADGVWTGGLGVLPGGGLSFVGRALQQFRTVSGTAINALQGVRTNALAVRGSSVWSGTDQGVVRVRINPAPGSAGDRGASGSRAAATQWGVLHGLPSDMATVIVPRDDGAWAGTSRGVVFIHDTSTNSSVRSDVSNVALAGERVRALVLVAETLLVGTNDGLYAMSARVPTGDAGRPTPRRLLTGMPAFRRPIQALAWSDSVLLVVTDQRAHLLSVNAAMSGSTPTDTVGMRAMWLNPPIADRELATVGAVVAAAVDERSVWIAGARGVLALSRNEGMLRVMYAGEELPDDVTSLALDDEWAWVGTINGLVRVRRAREGGLP